MPIGDFERELLRLLATNRNPESFVAGASVMLQLSDTPRESQDVDFFHDTTESLEMSVVADVAVLRNAGYEVEFHAGPPTFRRAIVKHAGGVSKIEWAFDSAFRFFPVEPDLDWGYRLNFWDVATNKVLAMAGRRAIRDYIDVIYLHERHLPLGALAWAAAGKDAGMTPELVVELASRQAKYRDDDLADLRLRQPVDLREVKQTWLQAADEAEALFDRLPPAEMGCFYLDASGKPVCPNPDAPEFPKLVRHHGCVKGAWPRIAEQ